MTQAAVINLATNSVSAIAPAKTSATLQADLATLEQEQKRVAALASSVDALRYRLTSATSGNLLGNVALTDLQRAQSDYDEAVEAVSRRHILEQAIGEARRALDYAQAQERKAFIDGIHKQFEQVYARYKIESGKLLEIFREMHRLNIQSQSMRSVALMDQNAYKLDLPAIRNPNDSELFSVGQMVRDGGM